MSATVLHPSHRWGQRPIFEREAADSIRLRERIIPCCLACFVDGYEDEPAAFSRCPRAATPEALTDKTKED